MEIFFLKLPSEAFLSMFEPLICSLSAFLLLEVVKMMLLECIKCFSMLILFVWLLHGFPQFLFRKTHNGKIRKQRYFSIKCHTIHDSSSNCNLLQCINLYRISKNASERKELGRLWKSVHTPGFHQDSQIIFTSHVYYSINLMLSRFYLNSDTTDSNILRCTGYVRIKERRRKLLQVRHVWMVLAIRYLHRRSRKSHALILYTSPQQGLVWCEFFFFFLTPSLFTPRFRLSKGLSGLL